MLSLHTIDGIRILAATLADARRIARAERAIDRAPQTERSPLSWIAPTERPIRVELAK